MQQLFAHSRRWILVGFALMAASLACSLPGRSAKPTIYTDPIPVSSQSVQELADNLEKAGQEIAQNGRVTLEISEAQLTSLVVLELQQSGDVAASDIRIYLREGQLQFVANVVQENLTLPLVIILVPSVSPTGGLDYEITYSAIGSLPIPKALMDQVTTHLDDALSSNLTIQGQTIKLETIQIADGVMTLSGQSQ